MAVDALMNQQPARNFWLLIHQCVNGSAQRFRLDFGHRIAAVHQLKERYKKISNLGLSAIQPELTNLQMIMDEAMPVETALKLGLPSLGELLS